MKSPLISVVIPTYNREKEITATIQSVLSQTYINIEILVVDDASTDRTVETVKEITDERIKIIQLGKNSKGTKTRNVGIQNSAGKYIALLDSDDEWLPDKLEKQLAFANNIDDERFLCFTDVILQYKDKEVIKSNQPLSNKDIMDYILYEKNFVQTSTYFFPTDIGKEVLFDPELQKHQDWGFCLRLRQQNVKFFLLPEPLVKYDVKDVVGKISYNNKTELTMEWGSKVKELISEKAYHSFRVISLVTPLILDGRKKEAFKIFFEATHKKALKPKVFIQNFVKIILPKTLFIKILLKHR